MGFNYTRFLDHRLSYTPPFLWCDLCNHYGSLSKVVALRRPCDPVKRGQGRSIEMLKKGMRPQSGKWLVGGPEPAPPDLVNQCLVEKSYFIKNNPGHASSAWRGGPVTAVGFLYAVANPVAAGCGQEEAPVGSMN